MQNIVIVRDDDLAEVANAEIQVLKQVWVDMAEGEKPFTLHLTKNQKNKNKILAITVGSI
jgi:hypothetical protein